MCLLKRDGARIRFSAMAYATLRLAGRFTAGGTATIAGFCILASLLTIYELAVDGHSTFPLTVDSLAEVLFTLILPGAVVFLGIDWILGALKRSVAVSYATAARII